MSRLTWPAVAALAWSLRGSAQLTTTSGQVSGLVEIDVVFPRQNATYNLTDTLPVVFAIRNLQAAVEVADLTFSYYVDPVDYDGITFPDETISIDKTNVDQFSAPNGATYLFINTSDITPSQWNLNFSTTDPNTLQLHTILRWDACNPVIVEDIIPFNLLPASLDSTSLPEVAGECAQEAVVASVYPQPVPTNTCSAIDTGPTVVANTCAVKLDAADVSSVVKLLAGAGDEGITLTATGTAAGATAMTATATATSPTTTVGPATSTAAPKKNLGVPKRAPTASVMAAAGVLAGLQLCLR